MWPEDVMVSYECDVICGAVEIIVWCACAFPRLGMSCDRVRSGYITSIYIWSSYISSILHLVHHTFGQLLPNVNCYDHPTTFGQFFKNYLIKLDKTFYSQKKMTIAYRVPNKSLALTF